MPLPASGAISLSQVNVELGRSATANISMNESAVRSLFGVASGAISMSQGYGKSSGFYRSWRLSTGSGSIATPYNLAPYGSNNVVVTTDSNRSYGLNGTSGATDWGLIYYVAGYLVTWLDIKPSGDGNFYAYGFYQALEEYFNEETLEWETYTVDTTLVARLNSSGAPVWGRRTPAFTYTSYIYNANTQVATAEVDSSGNLYIAETQTNRAYITKFNSAGSLVWTREVQSSARHIKISGNALWVVGETSGVYGNPGSYFSSNDYKYTLSKLDLDGGTIFAYLYTNDFVNPYSVAADPSTGGLLIEQRYFGAGDIVRFDANGNATLRLSSSSSNGTQAYVNNYHNSVGLRFAADSSGNIYVTRNMYRPVTPSIEVRKYNSSGTLVWARELQSVQTNGSPTVGLQFHATALQVGASGTVFIGGMLYLTNEGGYWSFTVALSDPPLAGTTVTLANSKNRIVVGAAGDLTFFSSTLPNYIRQTNNGQLNTGYSRSISYTTPASVTVTTAAAPSLTFVG